MAKGRFTRMRMRPEVTSTLTKHNSLFGQVHEGHRCPPICAKIDGCGGRASIARGENAERLHARRPGTHIHRHIAKSSCTVPWAPLCPLFLLAARSAPTMSAENAPVAATEGVSATAADAIHANPEREPVPELARASSTASSSSTAEPEALLALPPPPSYVRDRCQRDQPA